MADEQLGPLDVFPGNVILIIKQRLSQLMTNVKVQASPINSMNAGATISILPIGWDNASQAEIGTFPREPEPIQSYTLVIQCLISGLDPEDGIARLSLLSRRVRHTLMRDQVLRQALHTLRCTEGDIDERFQDVRVRNQRFLGSSTERGMNLMASTDVIVRTEVIG